MASDKTMVSAGFGFSNRATDRDLVVLLRRLLANAGLDSVDCIAIRAEMPVGPAESLAGWLSVPVRRLDGAALMAVAGLCWTRSAISLARTGLPSVAEAAALAGAGAGSQLLSARMRSATATCALARGH